MISFIFRRGCWSTLVDIWVSYRGLVRLKPLAATVHPSRLRREDPAEGGAKNRLFRALRITAVPIQSQATHDARMRPEADFKF